MAAGLTGWNQRVGRSRPRSQRACSSFPARPSNCLKEFLMNLVKLILDMLFSGDVLGKLTAFLGTDEEAAKKATAAAVPTILSSLAGLASTDEGARKLSSTMSNLDPSMLGNLTKMLTGDTQSVAQKGNNLLSSLFGDSLVSSISAAVGRYAGLDSGASKKLMSLIGPAVLGTVAGQWKNQGSGLGALANLLTSQQKNITDALPSGFSLADIPGLPGAESTLRAVGQSARAAGATAAQSVRRTAESAENATASALKWVGPLACLLLAALALWYFFGRGADRRNIAQNRPPQPVAGKDVAAAVTALRPTLPEGPAVPDLAALGKDVGNIFTSATQTLGNVRDAASAHAALPSLAEISGKIDGIRALLDKLPAATQTALGQVVGQKLAPLKEQTAKIMAAPGVSEQVRDELEGITSKLAGLNLAQVSKDATDIFGSLTKSLNGFKDVAAVEDGMPQLREISGKIDDLKRVQSAMSPGGQSMLGKLVTSAMGPLNQLIDKVIGTLGADAAVVRPILEEIVAKLTNLSPPRGQT